MVCCHTKNKTTNIERGLNQHLPWFNVILKTNQPIWRGTDFTFTVHVVYINTTAN